MLLCKVPSIFDDTQSLIVAQLKRMHQSDMEQLQIQLDAAKEERDSASSALSTLIELCHEVGLVPVDCDLCSKLCVEDDILRCANCSETRCVQCNEGWIQGEDEPLCGNCIASE